MLKISCLITNMIIRKYIIMTEEKILGWRIEKYKSRKKLLHWRNKPKLIDEWEA